MDNEIIKRYLSGDSIKEISEDYMIKQSAVDWVLERNGIKKRSHKEAAKISVKRGRIKTGDKSPNWKGGTHKSVYGYMRFTYGPNKGRPVHTVMMEEKIGRRIKKGEVVHHINGNKEDNRIENLKLMNTSDHGRIHNLGRKHSEKSKNKMSKTRTGLYRNKNSHKWIDVPLKKIVFALEMFRYRKDAAKYLGINKYTLNDKMRYYGIYNHGLVKNIKFNKIVKAVQSTSCITHAAKYLGIDLITLKRKLKKFNVTYEEVKNGE